VFDIKIKPGYIYAVLILSIPGGAHGRRLIVKILVKNRPLLSANAGQRFFVQRGIA
jgi:hypothetical protein